MREECQRPVIQHSFDKWIRHADSQNDRPNSKMRSDASALELLRDLPEPFVLRVADRTLAVVERRKLHGSFKWVGLQLKWPDGHAMA